MPGALRTAGLVTAVGAPDEGGMAIRIVGRDVGSQTGTFRWPRVDPRRLVLLGAADREEAAPRPSRMPEDLGIPVELSPAVVRSIGPEHVGRGALDRVGDKYWVHLDADVFDQREFAAIDYPVSRGLSLDDTAALLRPLTGSPGMIGFSVGCFNPDMDPDGDCARSLVGLLGKVLRRP